MKDEALQRRSIGFGFIVLAALAAGLCLPDPKPLWTLERQRGPDPYSGEDEFSFPVDGTIERFYVRTNAQLIQSGVRLSLAKDESTFVSDLSLRNGSRHFSAGADIFPGIYRIRISETNVLGKYRIEIYPRSLVTMHQRVLVYLLILLASYWLGYFYLRRIENVPNEALHSYRWIGYRCTMALFLLPIYLIFHEGGHSLALSYFGIHDLSHADWFGLHGTPHAGRLRGHEPLAPWKESVISISGPLLPSLAGYLIYFIWRTKRGTRIRLERPELDLYWSALTAFLLTPHIGCFIPMLGLGRDGDYSGFVNRAPVPLWVSFMLLILIGLINTAAIVVTGKRMIRLLRMKKQWNGTGGGSDTVTTLL